MTWHYALASHCLCPAVGLPVHHHPTTPVALGEYYYMICYTYLKYELVGVLGMLNLPKNISVA
jgi:hypothetical protein